MKTIGSGPNKPGQNSMLRRAQARLKIAGLLPRLSPGVANGLYCAAGVILTMGARNLAPWLRAWSWIVWIAGFGLTVTALAGSPTGMVIATTVTMASFCTWVGIMGWQHR